MDPDNRHCMNLRTSPRLAYWASWATAGLYNFCRDMFAVPWPTLMVYNLAFFSIWALLGLLAVPLVRRHPVTGDPRTWLLHLVAGALFAMTDVTFGVWVSEWVLSGFKTPSLIAAANEAFRTCFHLALMTYFGLVAVVQALDAVRLARQRAVELAEADAERVRAQLLHLKEQLQPHFLFNTLHAIGSLMHYDVRTAERMLQRLSDLLRMTLNHADDAVTSLRQELEFVAAFLEIEQIRFEQRLAVVWAVAEDAKDAEIPTLVLQPLVENAVKYGIAPRAAGGIVTIRARLQAGNLLLEVEDDAPALLPAIKGFGVGLANVRRRLEALYGQGPWLELVREGSRTVARLRVPLGAQRQVGTPGRAALGLGLMTGAV